MSVNNIGTEAVNNCKPNINPNDSAFEQWVKKLVYFVFSDCEKNTTTKAIEKNLTKTSKQAQQILDDIDKNMYRSN